jgi:predicted Co/Zn/Cd cation transporter (cation efflux family)
VREEDELIGADAVLTAIWGLEGHGHVIIMDNFFTSVKLFMTLLERGFYATCTIKKGSKGFPKSLAGFP